MKKMLKIMAMVLVIATVVFAAGCSSKGPETGTENETPEAGVTEAVNGTAVIAENNTTVIAENNTTIMTGENTTVVAENNTTVA